MPEKQKQRQTNSLLLEAKHKMLRKKLFKFGFECEFVFDTAKITFEDLAVEFRRLHRNIVCDDDGSIDPSRGIISEDGMEVKTPPLSSDEAFTLLQKVFGLIDKYGYTNKSCGLHVNFSPTTIKHYRAINPFSFSRAKLWAKIKKDFKRGSNTFCVDTKDFGLKKMTAFEWFNTLRGEGEEVVSPEHYHVVNFQNYYKRRDSQCRVEVRAFGNENYQKRLNDVIDYSEEIARTFIKHCSAKKIGLAMA
jgi:hypothetical protein